MTNISQAAAAARESARTETGQFGKQEHTAPGALAGGIPVVFDPDNQKPIDPLAYFPSQYPSPEVRAARREELREAAREYDTLQVACTFDDALSAASASLGKEVAAVELELVHGRGYEPTTFTTTGSAMRYSTWYTIGDDDDTREVSTHAYRLGRSITDLKRHMGIPGKIELHRDESAQFGFRITDEQGDEVPLPRNMGERA